MSLQNSINRAVRVVFCFASSFAIFALFELLGGGSTYLPFLYTLSLSGLLIALAVKSYLQANLDEETDPIPIQYHKNFIHLVELRAQLTGLSFLIGTVVVILFLCQVFLAALHVEQVDMSWPCVLLLVSLVCVRFARSIVDSSINAWKTTIKDDEKLDQFFLHNEAAYKAVIDAFTHPSMNAFAAKGQSLGFRICALHGVAARINGMDHPGASDFAEKLMLVDKI